MLREYRQAFGLIGSKAEMLLEQVLKFPLTSFPLSIAVFDSTLERR